MRTMSDRIAALAALAVLCGTIGVAAQAAKVDVTGKWVFNVETAAGSGTPTMTFKQEGEKLTGQYTGQLGEAPLTGTIKGNAIEFAIDVDVQGTAASIQRQDDAALGAAVVGGVLLGYAVISWLGAR